MLHGSRARGDNAPEADWDIGVQTDGSTDLLTLTARLTEAAQFWCDVGPVIRAAQDAVPAALG